MKGGVTIITTGYADWIDPPEAPEPLRTCDHCTEDLYEGEQVYMDENRYIYCSIDCFLESYEVQKIELNDTHTE